ncbi:outer envelope membrane protein 7 [Melia azedarach]|uniref:Outer envelope membrane protein 7 n=1 Tax=Melia azedarach TaxID=155640 RepID=A0ACC1WXB3_MELAZ|nr:outer envelope membrane protein 7 [Melia azedarach]
MAAITSAVIAIAGVVLGWIAIEIACKPCLEKGREAIDRSLNPDYDPDDEIRAPLNADPVEGEPNSKAAGDSATSSDATKTV